MNVTMAEAQDRLPELLEAVAAGATVVITREGQPVAQLTPAPPEPDSEIRPIQWGAMRETIKLLPGWDDPITEEELLGKRL